MLPMFERKIKKISYALYVIYKFSSYHDIKEEEIEVAGVISSTLGSQEQLMSYFDS